MSREALPEGRDVQKLKNSYPGSTYIIGELLVSRGRGDEAEFFFRESLDSQKSPWYFPALRSLNRLLLARGAYNEVVALTFEPSRRRAPDPAVHDWHYSQRFEARLRLGQYDRAFAELLDLRSNFPDFFRSGDFSHGLMYYQAIIAAHQNPSREVRELIEPYVFVSDARNGHSQLREILGTPSREDAAFFAWIDGKSARIRSDHGRALDIALELTDRLNPDFTMTSMTDLVSLGALRLDEGIIRDVFIAASETRRFDDGNEILSRILEIDMDSTELGLGNDARDLSTGGAIIFAEDRFRSRIHEYRGRLAMASGDPRSASLIFEREFYRLEELLTEYDTILKPEGSADRIEADSYTDIRELDNARERLLWLWISASMRIDGGLNPDVRRAFPQIRNPAYFRDISREHIASLVSASRWPELARLVTGAEGSLPPLWNALSLRLLDERIRDFGDDNLSAELQRLAGKASVESPQVVQAMVNRDFTGELDSQDLEYLLPLTRSVPASKTANLIQSREPDSQLAFLVQGFGDFTMYREAADILAAAPPEYRWEPSDIIPLVRRAYELGDWYGGMRLMESAVYRSRIYEENLDAWISAAGDVESVLSLLYPRPYREVVERETRHAALPDGLLYALMREESRFDASADSHAGAIGLGQIIPETAVDIARRMRLDSYDLTNPKDNIAMSASYLAYLRSRFFSIPETLAAYNGGQGRTDRWIADLERLADPAQVFMLLLYLPIEETRDYVPRVLQSWFVYEYLYDGDTAAVSRELIRPLIPR